MVLTTITGYLYDARGNTITSGKLWLTLQQDIITPAGEKVVPFKTSVDLAAMTPPGNISVSVVPTVGATPGGVAYLVEFDPEPSDQVKPMRTKNGYWSNYWSVPVATTLPIGLFASALRGEVNANYLPITATGEEGTLLVSAGPGQVPTWGPVGIGQIVFPTSGAFGYWARNLGTLSPVEPSDTLSILGNVGIGNTSLSGKKLFVIASASTDAVVTAQGVSGQAAALYQALGYLGNVVFSVNAVGTIYTTSNLTFGPGPSPMLKKNGINLDVKLADDSAYTQLTGLYLLGNSGVLTSSAGSLYFNARSRMRSPSDGVITMTNYAETGFTRLNFGGITDSCPALKRSGADVEIVGAAGGTTTSSLVIQAQKANSGLRYLCIDTNGKVVSSATAPVGT